MSKKIVVLTLLISVFILLWGCGVPAEVVARRPASDEAVSKATVPVVDEVTYEATYEEEVDALTEELPYFIGAFEKFFYHQLDEEERVIYRALRDGVWRGDEEIQLETDDIEKIHRLYRWVLFDYPEFFWVTGAGRTTVSRWSDGRVYASFEPEFGHTAEARITMQAEIDAAVDAFLTSVEPGLSEYELVRVVYEYLIRTTVYDLDAPDHQNIYSVFVNRESVCAGISKAAQLLLERLGIFATYVVGDAYVPGTSTEPIAHAWNLVRIYGVYYHLDVTWGSPGFLEGSTLADRIDVVYDYLLLNDELIFRTHTLDEGITLPPATSLAHNFFVMKGMFYETHEPERALDAMNTSILNGDDWIAFKFSTPELFESMRTAILEDLAPQAARNLAEWYDLESVRYYFLYKENLNKITIYWVYG
ncbi:MAG: hypothetical protein FWG67_09385 [Defluviitaleaceae bacterium]|nr:hypothetical protein [Defluviitaleaceae bacterium]